MLDELFCQALHGRWARVVSYSSQGAWRCSKPGCRAQARRDSLLVPVPVPVPVAQAGPDDHRHAA
jgi:hypothetical protein